MPDTCRLTELETVGNDSCSIPEEEEEIDVSSFKCKIFGISLSFGICTEFIYLIFPEFFIPRVTFGDIK